MNGPSETGPIDAELLGRLLDELGPPLALYASQWTDAAEDCVQEALVELARQPTVPENVRAWLYRVVKHRAINVARSTRRRRERETRAAIWRAGSSPTPTGAVDRPARWNEMDVMEALDRLEPGAREVIVMRIWGALSYDEIASTLSMSTSTVHRHYHRALEKLRRILEPPCSTHKNPMNSNSPAS
jgi:RNA polymerase sigma-70 factor (ECF subfamily)